MLETGGRTERVDKALGLVRELQEDGRLRYQKGFGFRFAQAMHHLEALKVMAEKADNPVERGIRVDD